MVFFFKPNVFVSCCSLKLVIMSEIRGGVLSGHFGRNKTLVLLQSSFYWPKMPKDVDRFVKQCRVCHLAKTRS